MKIKTRPPLALTLFRQLPSDFDEVMPAMRGNSRAKALLIAPPFSAPELEKKLPFCDEAASIFHNILAAEGLDTQQDFLVVSCVRYGLRPRKHSTDLIREFILACAGQKLFKHYVCVGDDAFKFIFGGGRKPPPSTLLGSVLHVPETGYAPLFTFPSPSLLCPVYGEDDWENKKMMQLAQTFNVKFSELAKKLAVLMKKAK